MFPLKDNIPLARFPLVTVALVAINAIVYLLAIWHGGSFFGGPAPSVAARYGAIPYEFTHSASHCYAVSLPPSSGARVFCQHLPQESRALVGLGGAPPGQPSTWVTAFTSMFVQGSFLAIFANMLFLVIFGATVEDGLGRWRFALFYLLGGLAALGVRLLIAPSSTHPTLGAAGAITAVLGGYILLHPRARILGLVPIPFLVTIVAVPAIALLVAWFAVQITLDLTGLTSPLGMGGGAQFGAFLFGLLAIRPLTRAGRGPAGEPRASSGP
jgi:membrane associated rhomboid family serine protease